MARPILLSADTPRKIPARLFLESLLKGDYKHIPLVFLIVFPILGWSQIPHLDFGYHHFYLRPLGHGTGEVLKKEPIDIRSVGKTKVVCYTYRYTVDDRELLGKTYLTLPRESPETEGLQLGQKVEVAYNLAHPEKSRVSGTQATKLGWVWDGVLSFAMVLFQLPFLLLLSRDKHIKDMKYLKQGEIGVGRVLGITEKTSWHNPTSYQVEVEHESETGTFEVSKRPTQNEEILVLVEPDGAFLPSFCLALTIRAIDSKTVEWVPDRFYWWLLILTIVLNLGGLVYAFWGVMSQFTL